MISRLRALFAISILLFSSFTIFAKDLAPVQETEVRMLINLMDYISKDYVMAVKDGEVINRFEYEEMEEFSTNALDYHERLLSSQTLPDSTQKAELLELQRLIGAKSSPEDVSAQASLVRDHIVGLGLVPLAPVAWPNHSNGRSLFEAQCATCHGKEGNGDGPQGVGLQPSPTVLSDRSIMDGVSPLQAFNTIKLGIKGTSMRAFTELSDEEVWDIAFYIMELPYAGAETQDENVTVPLSDVATMSNEALSKAYPKVHIPTLRIQDNVQVAGPMDLARLFLNKAESASTAGNSEEAISMALKAYLQGVEPVEPKIKASDNQLFQDLESAMMNLRAVIKKGDQQVIASSFEEAYSVIDEAEALLGSSERSMWMTATITLSILIREGLEAFFVILAILGILQSMGATTAIRWVHSGWIVAVLSGVVGWFFAGSLMNWDAQSRELMEGLITLFAVAVLLYLGFWMHGKTNASKWKAFVEDKVKGLITKNNMIGLASFSFLVVFREAFESVLFLSSLTVDGSSTSSYGVLLGTLISAVLLFGIAWAMLRWFKKLPIAKVFLYSSIVVLALAFILAGEGIHAIQEGGFLDIRSFPLNLRFTWIGLYPTYETILTQLVVLGLIIALWKYSTAKASKA